MLDNADAYALVNRVMIGSGNGLSPVGLIVRSQAIIRPLITGTIVNCTIDNKIKRNSNQNCCRITSQGLVDVLQVDSCACTPVKLVFLHH